MAIADDIRGRFQDNLARVRRMVEAYESGAGKGKGRRSVKHTDLLRAAVILLHATLEDLLRNLCEWKMPGGPKPRPADPQNKSQLVSWLRLVDPDGGTDPRAALRQAISLRPEAVFLLSDGVFPDGTAESIAKFNARRIPIHCVDLSGGLAGDQLRRIARDSGGQYASRPGSLHGVP